MEILTQYPAGFHPSAPGALRRVFVAALILAAALLGRPLAAADTPVAPEYNVKAGFLVAFVQYTTWPESAFATPEAPLVIGVLGANPFGEVLAKTARTQQGGRRIEVRLIDTPAAAAGCHVVFIGKQERENEAAALTALKVRPILTVGESGQTIRRGGLLEFVVINNRVRFDASWPAMEVAGLKFSSPMLASAHKVYRATEATP